MKLLTAEELAAALGVSISTIHRNVKFGMPRRKFGSRTVRYDLDECRNWGERNCQSEKIEKAVGTSSFVSRTNAFTDVCRRVQLRVMPST